MALIGICGAHRTGKTTLAKKWGNITKFKYVDAGVSNVLRDNGFDPSALQDLDVMEFMKAQDVVKDHLINIARKYSAKTDFYIVDRTPIDACAYMKSYCNARFFCRMDGWSEDRAELFAKWYKDYEKECMFETAKRFCMTVLIQPGIELVSDKKSAPANDLFINHLNTLLLGDLSEILDIHADLTPNIGVMDRNILDLDYRCEKMDEFWTSAVMNHIWGQEFNE
jgi:nicotinamide riboside kinase